MSSKIILYLDTMWESNEGVRSDENFRWEAGTVEYDEDSELVTFRKWQGVEKLAFTVEEWDTLVDFINGQIGRTQGENNAKSDS